MKCSVPLLALAATANAHYTLPSLVFNGVTTPAWQHVRQWTGYYTNGPIQNVLSPHIRCNNNGSTISAPATLSVAAGSTLAFKIDPNAYHPGPELVYLAKVPAGKTAANWDGAGAVWFKIFQRGPVLTSTAINWPGLSATQITFKIPASTPSGEYLLRGEQIGLHAATLENGSQHYISCAQINITGGGSGKPGPLVAFPGAYSPTEAGIKINLYWPIPTVYPIPGPAVWTG